MTREELAAWLRLAWSPGVGDAGARRLLAAFGLPPAIFDQSSAALASVVGEAGAKVLQKPHEHWPALVETTWRWLQEDARRRVVTLGDLEYPPALLQIADPPLLLYFAGRPVAWQVPAVAVVGSRNPTPQGVDNARAFAKALAQAGVTIVSGMALGVDGAAHEGALAGANGDAPATVAVVGTGLDRVYPKRHHDLAKRIFARGLLVSEYPLGTPPLGPNFPRRNRILSGLSQGTLVVEAAVQSGSLITARLAAEQGREVFAIPGSIHSPQARGCHLLLRQGAKLVESAQDLLEDLRLAPVTPRAVPEPGADDEGDRDEEDLVTAATDPLLEALGHDPVSLDALIARTGIPAARLQGRLLELELAGEVARLPGGLIQRVGSA